MAFKTELRDKALPIPQSWSHDAWLALVAAAQGDIVAVPTPLISYRQHATNAVGGLKLPFFKEAGRALALDRNTWNQFELTRWNALASRLSLDPKPVVAAKELAEKIVHLEARANLPNNRWQRFPAVMREIVSGRYARYARNWGSVAIDLLVR